jgi:hypothetical protein
MVNCVKSRFHRRLQNILYMLCCVICIPDLDFLVIWEMWSRHDRKAATCIHMSSKIMVQSPIKQRRFKLKARGRN